jgi:hypothetical protein
LSSSTNSQFTCSVCGDGFEQKSRLERHLITSHPPSAPSAADVERVLSGIRYPRTKKELLDLINSLPDRTYRDSAEVAVALGELKSGNKPRSAREIEETEKPSAKGGRAATTSSSISAATIVKVLSGIDFPKSKDSIKQYAQDNSQIEDIDVILEVLDQLAPREYSNMADVEREIGRIK